MPAQSTVKASVAAIEGWFTLDIDAPHLLGTRCRDCQTYFFPREEQLCRNPSCGGTDLDETELSRTGRIWSYTSASYQPPEPYIAADPFEPFAIAAVELAREEMVVLGQVATGVTTDDLEVGMEVEVVLEPLYTEDGTDHLVWKWAPTGGSGR